PGHAQPFSASASELSSFIEIAIRSKRTLAAFRLGALAQFLPVPAEQQVGLDQPGVILVDFGFYGFLNGTVRRGIALALRAEAKPKQDTQAVRLQCQHG